MGFARTLALIVATALLTGAGAWWVLGTGDDYDLGRVNSVEPSTRTNAGQICVNDTYDENHCRDAQPLILPAEPLEAGDCVEIRSRRRSDQIGVRAVADEACAGGPYGSDR